jgi:putative holliday junction resolvase
MWSGAFGRGNRVSLVTESVIDFAAALPDGGAAGGVLMGMDVGTKTVGTALCDARWSFASPAPLIRRTKFSKDVLGLAEVRDSRATVGLVIGLPLNLDGTDSPRTQSTRACRFCCGTNDGPPWRWSAK